MSSTAVRIGNSGLFLDWTQLPQASTPVSTNSLTAWNRFHQDVLQLKSGFYQAAIQPELSQIEECEREVDAWLSDNPSATDCVYLGIGGSALGPLVLDQALGAHARRHAKHRTLRLHFADNIDPASWSEFIRTLSPSTTLFAVVTKSGTTFETLSQLLLAIEYLGGEKSFRQFIVLTDPERGEMREWVRRASVRSLAIAPSVGGRYSIFTPVGLVALKLMGASAREFLLGAQAAREYFEKSTPEKNALLTIANALVANEKKYPTHVMMPYASSLRAFGSWFVQLWGESLGKNGRGFTPIAALGATDQHSLLQLLRDGPNDKITFMIRVDRWDQDPSVPKQAPESLRGLPTLASLLGVPLSELLEIERQATARALQNQSRPTVTLTINEINERTLGSLCFTTCALTAITGYVMGIDPYDQPGVEETKIYIRESLAKKQASQRELDDPNSYEAEQARAYERLRGNRE